MITFSHKLLSFRVHFLLLDLQELLLQGVVGGGEDGGGQHGVTLLLQHVIYLAVLAAEVEQQSPLLLEHGAAQVALEPRHHLLELCGQILHEVPAVVLLELALGGEGLVADLAHLVVTLVACAVYAAVFTACRPDT